MRTKLGGTHEESFNHQLLVLVRNFLCITQKDLAERTGLTQGTVSKLESGLQTPSPEVLARVSTVLGFPAEFFLQPVTVLPPATPFQRKRKSLSARVYQQIEAQANLYRMHSEVLLRAVELTNGLPSLVENEQSPVEVARSIRSFLRISRGPIQNVTALVEQMGVMVFGFDYGTDLIDGFTMATASNAYIFVNQGIPADRWRFSISHELGHLLMHRYPHAMIEDEANTFASELLMPEEDIRPQLRSVTRLEELLKLKSYWKVSVAALVMRMTSLKLRSPNQLRYFWMQIGQRGWRTCEPNPLDRETPTLVEEMLDAHHKVLHYSDAELCRALRIKPDLFRRLYPSGIRSTLKLIK